MNCKLCNKSFKSKAWNAIYCSNTCKTKYHSKVYYHKHKEKCLIKKKKYYEENKVEIVTRNSEYCDTRRKIDLDYRLKRYLRARLYNALKGDYKTGSAVRDLGCSIKKLKDHLESQFTEGMSWDNYGKWHIDHISPLSKFDLTSISELKKACHFTNLQPMWAEDNISKGNK